MRVNINYSYKDKQCIPLGQYRTTHLKISIQLILINTPCTNSKSAVTVGQKLTNKRVILDNKVKKTLLSVNFDPFLELVYS